MASHLIDVTLTLDTSIYADGDVLATTQEVPDVFLAKDTARKLVSVRLIDEDDQGAALDLVFLNADNSIGSENSAPNISDANARAILGTINIATTDYVDFGGSRIATLKNVGLILKSAVDSTSLYIAAITRGGTPTYTASGIKLKLGFE